MKPEKIQEFCQFLCLHMYIHVIMFHLFPIMFYAHIHIHMYMYMYILIGTNRGVGLSLT